MKFAKLSLAAIMALGVSASAADSFGAMFKDGKVSGEIRSMYYDRDDANGATKDANFAVGGKLKFETAAYMGVSFGAAFYTANDLGFNAATAQNHYLVDGTNSYDLLGEAYVQYAAGNTVIKIGRQQLDTPLAGADDIRIVPDLFESYTLINNDIADTTLVLAHVTKMAGWDSAASQSSFQSMSEAAGVAGVTGGQDGVTVAGAVYGGVKDATLQAWYYTLAGDLDAFYLQADYAWDCLLVDGMKMSGALQYIDYSGDDKLSVVDQNVWGAKLEASHNSGFGFDLAYNKYSDDPISPAVVGRGGLATVWGGYPEFAYADETWSQAAEQDADVFRIGASYDFSKTGVNGLNAAVAYVDYDNMTNDVEVVDFILEYAVPAVANLSTRLVYEDIDNSINADQDLLKLYVGYTF